MPLPPTATDAELLARVAAQEEAAFAELYRRFAPGLFSMVHRIVGEAEAEDVLQEAFMQMWKRAATYEAARSSPFTWAVMIARHKAIDRLRMRQRREQGAANYTLETTHTAPVSDGSSGGTLAAMEDERQRVIAALEHIPQEQRQALQMAFFEGLTYAAISERLKTPLGTIKARIRRGLMALHGFLQIR